MEMSTDIISIPQVTLQYDIQNVIHDVHDRIVPAEDIWVSCYRIGHASVHGKATVQRSEESDGDGVELVSRDGVDIRRSSNSTYTVSCPGLSITDTCLRLPRQVIGELDTTKPRRITAFDVSPDGSLMASGDYDGCIIIQPASTTTTSTPRSSKIHLSTVLSLRFFPSSQVLLSSSSDNSISIISATDLSVPRTLKGHTRGVTDTAIIDRGRNVLSCAKDGTVRLWDVGEGKKLNTLGTEGYSPAMKIALGEKPSEWDHPPPDGQRPAANQPETDSPFSGKLVYTALQSGSINVFDLGSKTLAYKSPPPPSSRSRPSLHSIAVSESHNLLATGSVDGVISLYDTRYLTVTGAPLFSFQRSGAAVDDLSFAVPTSGGGRDLIVASEDGLPFRVSVHPEGPVVVEELAGCNNEGVRVIRCGGDSVWTAGDDGVVRRY